MQDQTFNLNHLEIEEILEIAKAEFPNYEYDLKKHLIHLMGANFDPLGLIRLPLHFQIDKELNLLDTEANALYLTVESGNAAVVVMVGEEMDYHTTFSAYMTRKKQGFSQIKYLNKKGKSRAGSRVRLAETTEFFESINTSLNELWEDYSFSRLGLNCTKTLLPYLFQAKVPFPIDKTDPMLYKIPLHLPQSNFTNLQGAIDKLNTPILIYPEGGSDLVLEPFQEY